MNETTWLMVKCLLQLQTAAILLYITWQQENSKRWLNRRWLIRPINRKRMHCGYFYKMFQELKLDSDMFFRYTRMDVKTFNYLIGMLQQHLSKRNTRADVIQAEQRLAVTLRYLATGDEILSLALDFRIGESTVIAIIKETCEVIFKVLSHIYLRAPCKQVWRNISKGFYNNWNIPNCVGAVDGKHIRIKAPANSGSLYYNYKNFHSLVLLAVCNHRYEFTIFDVGAFGGESDGGIFARSNFGRAFNKRNLDLPEEQVLLPNTNVTTPYYFIGDEAFQMTKNFMRPYPGRNLNDEKRIFNYRLSRARRCIENAFGILVSRWRVFCKPIGMNPEYIDKIILATVCLHNFLMSQTQKSVRDMYCPPGFVDEQNENENITTTHWRQETDNSIFNDLQNISSNRSNIPVTEEAHAMRDTLAKYFVSPEGQVSWQYEYIHRGRYKDIQSIYLNL